MSHAESILFRTSLSWCVNMGERKKKPVCGCVCVYVCVTSETLVKALLDLLNERPGDGRNLVS